jgi:hypothetical protein
VVRQYLDLSPARSGRKKRQPEDEYEFEQAEPASLLKP